MRNDLHDRLTKKIFQLAEKMGFDLVGIVRAEPPKLIDRYEAWLEKGYAGEMEYLHRHLPLKKDPKTLLAEVRSIICFGVNYHTIEPDQNRKNDPNRGQISRYAWGDDYHDVIKDRLRKFMSIIEKALRREVKNRIFVDSGPILEREYAQNAGLGWIGKNTNLINWQKGSWYFLAEILTNLDLVPTEIEPRGSCGTCTKCIEACPTDAIIEPNVVDSRRCISYLTIELKNEIPIELRPQIGNWIFGCDICQEVCPWNRKSTPTKIPNFQPRSQNLLPKLTDLINITQKEFSDRFSKSPIKRSKRRGFLRNVAVAIGNSKDPFAVPFLSKAINDLEPLIRQHVAWALGEIGTRSAIEILEDRLKIETETSVISEIETALKK